jgi:hypothetical protein
MSPRYDVMFVGAALVYSLIGITLGIGMGVAEKFGYAHVHAHINLIGWATFAIYGLVHRAWPALRTHPLARIQFWVAMAGAPVFLIGLPFAMFEGQPIGAIVGSLLLLASAILFTVLFLMVATRSAPAERMQRPTTDGLVAARTGA